MHAFSKRSVWSPASAQSLGLESGSPTRDPRPSSSDTGLTAPGLSVPAGSSQAPGLGLGGSPESGLSSPLSALQLITSSGSPSHTSGKFNLPTIAGGERQNFPRVKTTSCNRETFPVLSSATKKEKKQLRKVQVVLETRGFSSPQTCRSSRGLSAWLTVCEVVEEDGPLTSCVCVT